ncbi:MAG TPA: hypothetical protein VIV14_12650 [Gammaproteobacteria bacterium]
MKRYSITSSLLPAIAAGFLVASPSHGQPWVRDSVCPDDNHAAFHACALEAANDYDPPRNVYGQPDLSGIWRRRATAHESIEEHQRTLDDGGGPSIIVDPPSGITPIQPWAEAQRRQNRAQFVHHNAICRLDGVPLTMYMTGTYQFMQNADYFLVQGEEAHAYRMIALDGREHLGEDIRLWNGDSIGRWDGNTLVIETRNQNARAWLDQRGRFFTDEAHVVERLTLIDDNTLHYQATLDDPNVYTRPFTIAIAYRRADVESWELLEEACYENNEAAWQQFMNVGYEIYPGITGEEARRLKAMWDIEEAGDL